MKKPAQLEASEWLIVAGALLFVFALFMSAYWEADIRLLHFFQAWMYLSTMYLTLRHNRWGYFLGFSIAVFWDYTSAFVTTFFRSGLSNLAGSISTGHLQRPDQMIAIPAFFGNVFLALGCIWAYFGRRDQSRSDAWKLLAAFALSTGYFWLDIALFQPRYLGLFPALLHPHAP